MWLVTDYYIYMGNTYDVRFSVEELNVALHYTYRYTAYYSRRYVPVNIAGGGGDLKADSEIEITSTQDQALQTK
jgi:hypothetical protein